MKALIIALVLLFTAGVACGKPQVVGNEALLKFEEEENAKRLGEKNSPSPVPSPDTEKVGLGQKSPSPSPEPQVQYFEIALTSDSPYFQPGNALVVAVGATIRVTNKDNEPNRPTRSFTAKDGSFDSGDLKPGQTWIYKVTRAGFWDVVDSRAPFIFATMEAR